MTSRMNLAYVAIAALALITSDVSAARALTLAPEEPEAPAEKAALEENDVIRAVDKKPVDGFQALLRMIGERNEGDRTEDSAQGAAHTARERRWRGRRRE